MLFLPSALSSLAYTSNDGNTLADSTSGFPVFRSHSEDVPQFPQLWTEAWKQEEILNHVWQTSYMSEEA